MDAVKKMDKKGHWENVYEVKQPHEVSWTQQTPYTSLHLINSFDLPKDTAIIDVGGGDSKLVDFLLDAGYTDITVLDISAKALDRAKQRLGAKAAMVKWIVCDVTQFMPDRKYGLWHDRAAFHFLTAKEDIEYYKNCIEKSVIGYMIIGAFSETGPKKCSGLDIKQYSEDEMQEQFNPVFEKLNCIKEEHTTPFNTTQDFIFCSFKRRDN
jgi:hypothetical protein